MKVELNSKLNEIETVVGEIYGNELHKKRQQSIASAAMGILASESLFLHKMGEGLAKTRGIQKKHATKQIDRLLSNKSISIWDLSSSWVKYVIGNNNKIIVALDWTSFFDDDQLMLSLNIVTSKGLSTPLLWKSVDKQSLKHNRSRFEDQLLSRFKEVIPAEAQVTLLADRGFADHKFFKFLDEELKFKYIVRIKSSTTITHKDKKEKAINWLNANGRIVALKNPLITLSGYKAKHFVAIKDKGMRSPWLLVSNTDLNPREIVNNYSKRWKIEPYFRDLKDNRFGLGLGQTNIRSPERRDRLMLILSLTYLLLSILGQAGEELGFDRKLKVNTVKTRTHSLFRQGQFYYDFFLNFTEEEKENLMQKFNNILNEKPFWVEFLSTIK